MIDNNLTSMSKYCQMSAVKLLSRMVVGPLPLPGIRLSRFSIRARAGPSTFTIALKISEILAPRKIPRYIQRGISRTGERVFPRSTKSYAGCRSVGDLQVSRRSRYSD